MFLVYVLGAIPSRIRHVYLRKSFESWRVHQWRNVAGIKNIEIYCNTDSSSPSSWSSSSIISWCNCVNNNLNRTLTWKISETVSSLEQTYENSLIIMNRVQYKFLARLIENTTLKKLKKVGKIITMLSSIVHHWNYPPTHPPSLIFQGRRLFLLHQILTQQELGSEVVSTSSQQGLPRHQSA